MLVSVSAPASASGAADYYVKGSAKNPIEGEYYLSQDGPSFWSGGAKEALGLPDGPVQAEDLINMMSGKLPNGQQLGRMIDGKLVRDMARDFTVSAPKSASILALGPYGKPIMQDFIDSVAMGIKFMETNLVHTRIHDKDTGKQVVTGGQKMVCATFVETLNRANEPLLHAHNVWPNIALGEDGKFRSALMDAIYTHKILMGAVIRGYFGDKLKNHGLSLEPSGKHGLFEIKGVPRETIEAFSSRRADILEAAKGGSKDAITLSRLVLKTRPAKTKVNASDLIKRHKAIFDKLGQSIKSLWDKAIGLPAPEKVTPADALANAVADLSETQSNFERLDLLKAGLISVYGNVTVDALQSEIDKQVEAGKLLRSADGQSYTTPQILRSQDHVISEIQKGHLKGGIISAQAFKAAEKDLDYLTKDQFAAAKLILTDRDRFSIIQGDAGTGKTTLLKYTLPFAKAAGLRLIGIAPTNKAVGELENTGMFDRVMTTQKFVISPVGNSSTLLVVDEASMLGTEDMLSISRFANNKNMPGCVFMGDTNQLPAVPRGTPFKDLQKAGFRTAHLSKIVRQEDPRHRQAVTNFAKGNIRQGLKNYDKEVHEVTRTDITKTAVQVWRSFKDPKAPVIVQTHKQKQLINEAIKDHLLLHQYKPPAGVDHTVWRQIYLKAPERTLLRGYEDITHIRFSRAQKKLGVRAGEVYKITRRNQQRSSLTLRNGRKRLTFTPAKHGAGKSMVETYRQDSMTLHAGDRVRFTRSQRGRVANNDLGVIREITDSKVSFELDKGKTISLPRDGNTIRHLDHGWASTAYAVQGTTVPNAITIMPSHKSHLTTLESLYVGTSRHRARLAIITDNSERLIKTLEADLETKLKDIVYKTDKPKPKTPAREMQVVDPQTLRDPPERQDPRAVVDKLLEAERNKKTEIDILGLDRKRQDRER